MCTWFSSNSWQLPQCVSEMQIVNCTPLNSIRFWKSREWKYQISMITNNTRNRKSNRYVLLIPDSSVVHSEKSTNTVTFPPLQKDSIVNAAIVYWLIGTSASKSASYWKHSSEGRGVITITSTLPFGGDGRWCWCLVWNPPTHHPSPPNVTAPEDPRRRK